MSKVYLKWALGMPIALGQLMSSTVKTKMAKRNTMRNTNGQFTNAHKEAVAALWGYRNDNSIRECDRIAARLLAAAVAKAVEVAVQHARDTALLAIRRAQAPGVDAAIAAETQRERYSVIRHGLFSVAAIACLVLGAWACVR
jgi:hypothetical protein